MGGGTGGGTMTNGSNAGGGAIAAGGGAVCWAQAASARTAPSTYRCFIVNPPGLMSNSDDRVSVRRPAPVSFLLALFTKVERPLCRVDRLSDAALIESADIP